MNVIEADTLSFLSLEPGLFVTSITTSGLFSAQPLAVVFADGWWWYSLHIEYRFFFSRSTISVVSG